MLLGVMSNKEDVMLLPFFPWGLRVNAFNYKEVLEKVVKPWIESVSKRKPYSDQQDTGKP